jgi:hypothetical protein
MPLIRGPGSVYLQASRASLAFEAQVRLLLGSRNLWPVWKRVVRNWRRAGAVAGAS